MKINLPKMSFFLSSGKFIFAKINILKVLKQGQFHKFSQCSEMLTIVVIDHILCKNFKINLSGVLDTILYCMWGKRRVYSEYKLSIIQQILCLKFGVLLIWSHMFVVFFHQTFIEIQNARVEVYDQSFPNISSCRLHDHTFLYTNLHKSTNSKKFS